MEQLTAVGEAATLPAVFLKVVAKILQFILEDENRRALTIFNNLSGI
jgi:hypothetical protein